MSIKIFVSFNLLNVVAGFLVPEGLQIAQTRNGEIHGILSNVDFDGKQYGIKKFLGIPYAEPPVGRLRFRKPLPVKPFTAPFKATKYSPICPQNRNFKMSEDCLYLNIFVPVRFDITSSKQRPVMVWIHGGGFVSGSGSYYETEKLCVFTDTIIVTINYRLGALGFFSTADQNAAGNYGLWDQHLALRWVHDNIEAFGGDPDHVTIFGGSAGSSSVIYQAAYPGNRGLFKRVIAESGTIAGWATSPYSVSYNHSVSFAKAVGCNQTKHHEIVLCLRSLDSNDLIQAVIEHSKFEFPYATWVPVYDNDFVVKEPLDMFHKIEKQLEIFSSFHDLDLLIGWNNLDGLVYLYQWLEGTNNSVNDVSNMTVSKGEFNSYYIPNIAKEALQMLPTQLTKSAISQEYTYFDDPDNNNELIKNLAQMSTDALLAAPTVLTANAHVSSSANTFVYRFSARPPYRLGGLPTILDTVNNADHAEELFYVFGVNLFADYFFPDPSKIPQWTTEEMKLTKTIMSMWGNFAKTGNPNRPTAIKPYFDLNWRQFTKDDPVFLEISFNMTHSSVKSSKSLRGVDFWNRILSRIQKL